MKVAWHYYGFLVLAAALCATLGAPADKQEKIPETVDFVPLEANSGSFGDGVVDVDASDDGFFGNPFGRNPFPSLFNGIEDIITRMRQQLSQILGRLPERPEDSPFPELHIPHIGDIDLGKGNTTSVTKVIDGHRVTINETEYRQGGENGTAAVFKVRIIDVHPESNESGEVTTADGVVAPVPAQSDQGKESVEDAISNEIPKNSEDMTMDNIESFDESEEVPPYKRSVYKNFDWNNGGRSVETIEDNSIEADPRRPVYDLSNDIYVNQLLADSGAPTNPDAEVFLPPYTSNNRIPQYRYPPSDAIPPYAPYNNEIPYYAPPTYPFFNQKYLPPPPPLAYQQLQHRFAVHQPPFPQSPQQPFEHHQIRSLANSESVSPSSSYSHQQPQQQNAAPSSSISNDPATLSSSSSSSSSS